jgi:hypothetical protein
MNIEQEIKDLQARVALLEQQLSDDSTYDWDNAPIITNIDGIEYRLGSESPNRLTWDEAMDWCESVGGELPSREVLLMCYVNENIRINFKEEYYWSSTEFSTTQPWCQGFKVCYQYYNDKTSTYYVRAVRRYEK